MFRHVMIFGGTGSLGTMLVKMWQGKVQRFTIFTRDEYKQWALRQQFPGLDIRFVLGDIADKGKVYESIVGADPTLIIVASAMKHVERCEENIRTCLYTNSLGLLNIVDSVTLAFQSGIELSLKKLMMVSTDKACAPINVYGMSKSICEHIIQNSKGGRVEFVCVRYGNVINSNGSIIPLLKKQALDPNVSEFTLTDPRMTRFYMTLEDSVNLIEDCVRYGNNGEIWIPKLDSMNILSLMEIFSECYGKPIRVVGIRPGEKIHESLISSHESLRTNYIRIEGRDRYILETSVRKEPYLNAEYSSSDNIIPKNILKNRLAVYLDLKFSNTVVILGTTGMLGGYIYRYLSGTAKYDVIGVSRQELSITRDTTPKYLSEFLRKKVSAHSEKVTVINCIGLTNKVSGDYELVNSMFPKMINTICECNGWLFVQVSTDCVFDGERRLGMPYTEADIPDDKSDYGLSKLAGECGMVIRLSVIGEDTTHRRGLLEYVRQTDVIQGYTNHVWTGVTCLEYAKILDQILEKNIVWSGPRHIVPPYTITKFELIKAIIEVAGWTGKVVNPHRDVRDNNKQLSTVYETPINISPIYQQLQELKIA